MNQPAKLDTHCATFSLTGALEKSGSGFIVLDDGYQIIYANQAAHESLGIQSQHRSIRLHDVLPADSMDLIRQSLIGVDHWRGDLRWSGDSSGKNWLRLSISRYEEQDFTGYSVFIEDISRLKQAQHAAEILAHYCHLTNLPNRRMFMQLLQEEVNRLPAQPFTVVFIDLDGFKAINDSLGHEAGDELLKQVSNRLKNCVRKGDTVARLAGDEFTLLLKGADDPAAVESKLWSIVESISQPYSLRGKKAYASMSCGYAMAPRDGLQATDLLNKADAAMFKVKESGKKGVQAYTQELNQAVTRRAKIEQELNQAIEKGELELYYQPLHNYREKRVVGYEALIRWNHPDGQIAPDEFIGVAEESGAIIEIGYWIIRQACHDIKKINAGQNQEVRCSLNVSPLQFTDPNLIAVLESAIEEAGIRPQLLDLEITESMLMVDSLTGLTTLKRLRNLGVTLSIDDFGTGYSSLSYLKRFQFENLKIDGSFINSIPTDEYGLTITNAIISMAQALGIDLVAEGVEKLEQADYLLSKNCDIQQGYLFSKPQKLAEIMETLKTIA